MPICNISPGDTIVTSDQVRKLVNDIVISEDGTVKVTYEGAKVDYMPSNHIVLLKGPAR